MKENKKAILEILKKNSKKDGKFENLVLNLALQKIDSDSFEFDGDAVYTNDKKRLVYCMSQEASFTIPEGSGDYRRDGVPRQEDPQERDYRQ